MPQVDYVDYPNKRIYLHADTVTLGVDPVAVYKEVRALRRTTEDHRKYSRLISSQGNEPKGGGTFTPRRAVMLGGARMVPYNVSHTLRILVEVITDDELSGSGAFDRLPLDAGVEVDIDIAYQQVEIREVVVGGSSLTVSEIAIAVWGYIGAGGRSLTDKTGFSLSTTAINSIASSVWEYTSGAGRSLTASVGLTVGAIADITSSVVAGLAASFTSVLNAIAPKATQASVDALQSDVDGITTQVDEMHTLDGLNPSAPLTVSDSQRQAGSITQAIADNGTTTTVTRQ